MPKTCFAALALLASASTAHAAPDATEMLKAAIGYRTVEGQGQVPAYANYLAGQLKASGFAASDVEIVPLGETAMLVARYRGSNPKLKPILLSGHMDVVEARKEDWGRDPFTATVENGFLYGRGVSDNKLGVVTMIVALAQLKEKGFKPKRDIIMLLSGDEETGMATTRALAARFNSAEMLLNGDAGGGLLGEDGKPQLYTLQAGEKTYADFTLSFTGPGGHSSRPSKENLIIDLARALEKIAAYQFPPQSNPLTLATMRTAAEQTPGALGDAMRRFVANPTDAQAADVLSHDPEWVGQVRTTCVATMVNGGHAQNALPQSAKANINCRIFPGVSVDSVKAKLVELVANPSAKLTVEGDPAFSDASPLRADVMAAVRKAVDSRAPGLPIVPNMSAGGTDSLYFRARGIPSYGVGGVFIRPSDSFEHGLNERVPLDTIEPAVRQWVVLLTEIARK